MFPKNVKTTLLCGPKDLSKSFLYEAAMYWAEEGQQLVYITPILLEKRPAICHDRRNPSVTALKLMRFIYLSDYEALEQHLYKLHTYATMVPSVLLIDELDDYLLSDEAPGDNNSCIAKICALILHSMNLCSRILEKNYIKPACFFAGFLIPAGLEYCIVLAEVLTKSASQPIR